MSLLRTPEKGVEILVNFIKKYKHGLVILIYSIVYLIMFFYLEHRTVYGLSLIHI